ncbi:MAG: PKD domain-containing protein [Micrococcaceae bacterium]
MTDLSGTTNCVTDENSCASSTNYEIQEGANDIVVDPGAQSSWDSGDDMVLVQTLLVDTAEGTETPQGFRCIPASDVGAVTEEPVVITVTLSDFKSMPIKPLQANAGPADGWLPVNMTNVLHTDPAIQELSTELLDTPVAIRAIPTSFHWDLGDGNTITTTNPGKPYPSETVSAAYTQEGWYDITLTTTFSGQFSVNGGEWQDIDGTIEIASDPVPIYSKSLESKLVNSDIPLNEDEDPWLPERTADTEGPQDPAARHRTI